MFNFCNRKLLVSVKKGNQDCDKLSQQKGTTEVLTKNLLHIQQSFINIMHPKKSAGTYAGPSKASEPS